MPPPANESQPVGAEAPALLITGMHRSGTSLASALLAAAGVHIGEHLMGPGTGNPRGHFEDLEFVHMHERILAANGLSRDGFTCHDSPVVPPTIAAEARALRDRRRRDGRVWGWKDPRTTLFLDFWAGLIPEARLLFVVRPPWEVVDSLFRRGDEVFTMHPRLAVDLWVSYNRRIRDFVLANSQRCAIVDIRRLAADPAGVVEQIGDLLGRPLNRPRDLYEPDLLETGTAAERRSIVEATRPDSVRLYTELRELAGTGAVEMPDSPCPDLADAAIAAWWRGIAQVRESQVRATADRAALENRLVAERDHDVAVARQQAADATARWQAERDHDVAVARQQAADATARWQAERAAFESERRDLEHRLYTAQAELYVARDTRARRRRSIGERVVAESRRFLRRIQRRGQGRIEGRAARTACEAG